MGHRSRRRIAARCARCRMHVPLCLCAILPRITTRTRVVLAVHDAEWDRPSNTGRVAVLALVRAELAVWDRTLDPRLLLREGHRHLLLHPGGEPRPLEARPLDEGPVSLLVPDGTWRESSRIARRLAQLPGIERVRLEVTPERLREQASGLRDAPRPGHLGTCAAIADALEILGERDEARALREALRVMRDRTLWVRGKLPAEQVAGGLSLEVRRRMAQKP